jgi:hypothetical protein
MDAALDAVAGVVGEVPVKDVELVLRHHVHEPLEHLEVLRIAPGVVHKPAPGEGGRIADDGVRHHERVAVAPGQLA